MTKHLPHHQHRRGHHGPHHHGERLMGALARLIIARPNMTTKQLAEHCQSSDEPEALELANLLNTLAAEQIPPGLALAKLASELDIPLTKETLACCSVMEIAGLDSLFLCRPT